ncbi:MAG TPA: hypothetical protein VFG56_01405 [Candidatus Saccharimonadales bacterium]|nr:hypothetical protein [Candidatus Saccharimonadales bacterium]
MPKTRSKKKVQPLSLHQLITALSFWGSSVRFLTFLMLAAVSLVAVLSQAGLTVDYVQQTINLFIYVLLSFLLFDVGFVMLGRGLPLKPGVDRLVICVVDLLVVCWYVIPRFALVSTDLANAIVWLILGVLVMLSLRAVLGLLFTTES